MRERKVFLLKPDGSVGYEQAIGRAEIARLADQVRVDVETRKAAVADGAGTEGEIKRWRLVIARPWVEQ
jgi:hypothetical protein